MWRYKMTAAQMNVLTEKLSNIDKRLIQVEQVQAKQIELLTKIVGNKIDTDLLRSEMEQLKVLIQSIKDEVEA